METVKPLKCCRLSALKTVLLAEMHSIQSLNEESVYANNLMTVFTSSFYQAICAWHFILLVKEPKSCFYLCVLKYLRGVQKTKSMLKMVLHLKLVITIKV